MGHVFSRIWLRAHRLLEAKPAPAPSEIVKTIQRMISIKVSPPCGGLQLPLWHPVTRAYARG